MEDTHSLVYLVQGDQVCLGMKKRGFGAGYWNGYGGKRIEAESTVDSAVRETKEESEVTLDPTNLERVAQFQFLFTDGKEVIVGVYIARSWEGKPVESEEMRPAWFPIKALPVEEMWESDYLWVPRILAGETLSGTVHFAADGHSVASSDIRRV